MIHFTMKILSYSDSGTFLVEYVPSNSKCTTIKLNIGVPATALNNTREILSLLKNSSPQDYWNNELVNTNVDQGPLQQLIDTTHEVRELEQIVIHNPIGNFSLPTSVPPTIRAVPGQFVTRPHVPHVGRSSPEQVASPDEQNKIKMKILIQEVLQEMADNTI